jgi:hypothetical protein
LRLILDAEGNYCVDVANFEGGWIPFNTFGQDFNAAMDFLHHAAANISPEWVQQNFGAAGDEPG